ncbi:MAG: hypothetical protein R3226_15995, partial [Halomonas venusta]|nr:hypothetical protein [Halomonas venusta]
GESAALKLDQALSNALQVVAIEYLIASQAFDLLDDQAFALGTELAWKTLRKTIPFYEEERPLNLDMRAAYSLLRDESRHPSFNEIAPHLYPGRGNHEPF